MTTFHDAFDGAELVRVCDDPHPNELVGVWHGGHTVNFYTVEYHDGLDVHPISTRSVGDYETGEVTREEVEEAIENKFDIATPDGVQG